jgi:NHL repeat
VSGALGVVVKRVRAAVVVSACLVGGLLVAIAPPVGADIDAHPGTVAERPRDAAIHAVDGEVHTLAQVGNRVVMGGNFTKVGPVTRGAVGVVDTVGKTFQTSFPDVVGMVSAVASDGAGGWYLGGTFTSVGGQLRTNLAQVDASGTVTPFDPEPNAPVRTLQSRPAGGVFVGGDFTAIAGGAASELTAFDGTPGLDGKGHVLWNATVTGGPVRSLAVSTDGTRVYLGGDFNKVSAITRQRLGAVSADTGALDMGFLPGTVNLAVNDMIVQGSALLIAGDFTKVNAMTRNRLARVDGASGALDALTVSINNSVKDIELDAPNNMLYVAGLFSNAGGQARNKLAGISLATGTPSALNVTNLTGTVSAVTLDGAGGLYVAGALQITPEKDNPAALAQVNVSTSVATTVVPYYETPRSLARPPVSGTSGPLVLVRTGTNLLVAGDFSDYGITTRLGLAAYDLATGALISGFDPAPDGQVDTVKATPDNSAIYVGGEFINIAGQAHNRLAKLDIATGANVPGFNPNANSYVKDMAVRPDGAAVYVGGNFDQFNGVPASRLVAIDPATGALQANFDMALTEPTNDFSEGGLRAMALSPDSTRLMVIGNFRFIHGIERPLVAQIDVSQSPAVVTDWQTDVYDQPCARAGKVGWMRDVDISPDGTKAYIVSSGHIYYPACDTANAFSMASAGAGVNVAPLWSRKVGDTMEAVAADTDTVYISGHFRYLETETLTQPRFQIAALDAQTGDGLNWIPNAGGFRGVLALELEPAGLFAGSDGDAFGVVNHGRNAFWPTPDPGIEVRKTANRPWVLAPGGNVTYTVRVENTFSDRSVTLGSLTDSRLGSLAGVGTCSVPQTITAGSSYTCQVGDTISGAAATTVAGTVTATATPSTGAPDVTDTDTMTVQILATAPVFRARVVVGPGVVVFPGQTVRFDVTLMNLDLERSATLTTLTSPQFGDLAAQCGLPLTLGPNKLKYCHVDEFVGGSVGSKPAYSFTAQAQYNTGTLSSSGSASVTISPPIGGTKVLAVVGNPAALSTSDKKLQDSLEDNFQITYVDDNTASPADVTSDYSFVILDPSVVPAKLGTRLAGISTPVLLTHSQELDAMGMTPTASNGTATGTTENIVLPMHPLSTAKSGTQTINTAAQTIAFGTPTSAAEVVMSLDATRATEFAYHAGATMTSGPAPGCRVFFSAANVTKFNATALAFFVRAAAYTSDNCGENMLWTAVGNGASAYGGADGRTSVAVGLNTPWGLAIDSQNRIYIADAGNNAVRRVAPDGTVTTVAGTGTAGFSGDGGQATLAKLSAPVRLTFDTAGNLYIADSANNRIRKVTPAGIISTVAGNGTAGFAGDGGAATAARLRTPYDVSVKPDGTMYIADRANHRIRKVTPAGIISTIAGTGTAGYSGDDGPATSARLSSPYSMTFDPAGNIYIADYDNERVRMINTGGTITTIAGTGVATADGDGGDATLAGLHKPQYVEVTPDGDLIISESNNDDVRILHDGIIDTLAGSRQFGFVGDGSFPIFSTWQRPSATVLDQQGNLWIADRGNHRIRVIEASSN